MRLLIIEDNDGMRGLLRELLSGCFEDVGEARSGEEGLRRFDDSSPDLIVVDNLLPGIDGMETARRMLRRRPGQRIVMVTDYDDVPFRRAARDAGIRGFFSKSDLVRLQRYVTTMYAGARRH